MTATSGSYFFWTDWLGDPAVRRLTLAERGLWIDLLALAAVGSPTGYVCDEKGKPLDHEEIARVTNAGSPVEVAELINGILEKGAASRDRTGRLFNRRMVRNAELASKKRLSGKLGGARTRLKWKEVLPQQTVLPQHPSLGQMPQHTKSTLTLQGKEDSSLTESQSTRPRGGATRVPPGRGPPPKKGEFDGSREPAGATGAPTNGTRGKPPSSMTRAELDALFAARRRSEQDEPI